MENRTLLDTTVDETATHYGREFIDYLEGKNVNNLDEIINKLDNTEGFIFIYSCMLDRTELWEELDLGKIKHDTNKDHKEFFDKLKILFGIAKHNDNKLQMAINQIPCSNDNKKGIEQIINNELPKIMKKQQESLSKKIEEQDKQLESLSKKIEEQDKHLEKYTSKINNIYSEFITILGIFTAITFAIFGGMNLLTNLFKNIGSTQASLGQTLILAAIFGLFMWGITELLFYWISKIKGITDSTKDKNKILFNRSALIVIVSILSLGVLLFTYTIK